MNSKLVRDPFAIEPAAEALERKRVVITRSESIPLRKWKGYCAETFRGSNYSDVDEYIGDVRGTV